MPRILADNDDDAQAMAPIDVAGMVHQLFSGFDAAVRRHRLFKVRRGRVVARRQSRPSLYGDKEFLLGLASPDTGNRMATCEAAYCEEPPVAARRPVETLACGDAGRLLYGSRCRTASPGRREMRSLARWSVSLCETESPLRTRFVKQQTGLDTLRPRIALIGRAARLSLCLRIKWEW